ncbi:hypothetical protein NLY43_31470 [Mesorhizobium sp. C416B]|uniref:hypothetical protein n=1 Tax=unclassified Mesorhizobium TaxID=325217 RepID=UPI0003CF961D|nr:MULTISPECIES: hypothetical protein [unclassified Mesorhizobium]ESX50425.1 hypothetical protein X762_08885 [Mesorhizobium sp. LSHC426A00]ESX57862.1 hypothetical protein X761_07800 [Mesorhizobium sp. LSHC424B00]ESX75401.1 hypothetical protein X758_04160 [Mesorhizobium sp. LSHC416B00]WJI63039.1 hypothetical protein NLY43_31470 [Mesorhizobium sp. C416B]
MHWQKTIVAMSLCLWLVPASAQTQSVANMRVMAYSACVQVQSSQYTQLDGSMVDIAEASMASCGTEAEQLQDLVESENAPDVAKLIMQKLTTRIRREALANVAETRLSLKRAKP